MARPGQLADALAEVFDLDPTTVRHQARMLRDVGHMRMERGGRGKGSMTPRDAANLLISVAGASRVKYAVRPVEQHAVCRSRGGAWQFPFEGLPELLTLPPGHTFADTIEAMLQAVISGSIDLATGALGVPSGQRHDKLRIEVDIREPSARSVVRIGFYGQDENGGRIIDNLVEKIYEILPTPEGFFDPPFQACPLGDLSHTHSFTETAIYRLAKEFL